MTAPPNSEHAGAAPLEQESTAELIEACLAGDDTARARFISRYGEFIWRGVARKLAAHSTLPPVYGDVDDVYNEFIARLLADDCRMLRRLRGVRRIDAWLMVAARNHAVDYVRRWASRMRGQMLLEREPPPAHAEDPAASAIRKERAETTRALVALLGPRDKLVVDLYFMHGLKYSEIAEVTGQNINTVAARLHRAKQKLRRKWLDAATDENGGERE